MPKPKVSQPPAIVVMGVSGSGKSTVGEHLAAELGAGFIEGDQLHPPENVARMAAGLPLDDEHRWPWLEAVAREMRAATDAGRPAVAACSALRRAYRDFLRDKTGLALLFVHLDGSRDLIRARMERRRHHFMPASLLDTQFATLEPPAPDEWSVRIDLALPLPDMLEAAGRAVDGALASGPPSP